MTKPEFTATQFKKQEREKDEKTLCKQRHEINRYKYKDYKNQNIYKLGKRGYF